MLFVTGLLTLLVFSSARGDAKGGVKGSASASQPVQQITQEEATPYNFAIQSPASYGTKVTREESGDGEGRVKGSYTIQGPRGTSRVVQYQADDTGFHANVKTSEPNVKTHSPSNAEIQAVAKGGSPIAQGSQQVQGKVHHASTLHHSAAADDSPVSDSSATRGIKTVIVQDGSSPAAVKGSSSSPAAVKGLSSSPAAVKGSGATKSFAVAQQQGGAVLYAPKTAEDRIKELNRGLLRKQEEEGSLQGFGGADASFTADELEDLSRRFGVGEEKLRTPAQVRPDVARTSPERAPASRRPAAPARSGSSGSRTQGGEVSRPTFGQDAGVRSPAVLREPVAVPVRAFQAPAPVAPRGGEGIIAINRGLLQKQGEAGLAQTFGGIVGADGNLAGVSVTDAELENLSKQIGFGARAPVAAARPQVPKPAVVRTSPQQVPRGQGRPGSSTSLVRVPVAAQVPRTTSPKPVQPASGIPSPAGPSSALGDRIIAINRELLQKQGETGLDQTFGGIVRGADGNLAGVSVTDAELQDFSKQIGLFGSRAPASPKPEAPKPARPSAVRTSPQQVPATRGQYQVIPGVSRIFGTTYTQRENTRFNFGNNIGIRRPVVPAPVLREPVAVPVQTFRAPSPANLTPVPQGDSIIAINRQLIQKQGETGVAQTFGGIGGADGNLAGVSITDLELQDLSRQIGFGYRSPTVPQAPRPARPSVVRTSPQQTPGYRRPVQVIPGLSGISGITGTTFTSTGGARIARPYYPAPALRVPVPGAVPVIRAGVSTPLSQVPVVRVTSTAPVRPSQLSDDIISINRELIQKQGEAGFDPTFGGVVGTGGNLDGVSITDLELQDLTRQIGFGSRAPEAPKPARPSVVRTSPQYIPESGRPAVSGISRVQGTRITSTQRQNTIFTNAGQVKPVSPAAPSPASRKPAPVPAAGLRVPSPSPVSSPASGSPGNLIAINRQLIQKQETSGFSQAFGGIARTDGNLAGLSLTTSDLENLSKQIGFDSRPQAAPEQPRPAVSRTSPQQVPGSRPYAPGSRIPGDSQSTIQGGNIRFTLGPDDGSLGLTQPGAPVPRAPSPAAPRAPSPAAPRAPSPGLRTPSPGSPAVRTSSPGLRTPSPGFRTPSSGSPGLRTPSPGSPALRSPSGGASRTPSAVAARAPTLGSGAGVPASEAIVAINRGLIQKQGEGGLSQIFGGAIRTDADLSGLSLTASELEDLSKQIGTSGRPQAVSEPRRPRPSRPQQASGPGRQPARSRGPQGSTRGGEGLPKRVSQDRVIQESFEDQKLIDSPSDENDSQLQVKLVDIEDPSIQSQVSLGDFSETAYVPPFNYRVPSSRPVDGPQEQQKVEQVFV